MKAGTLTRMPRAEQWADRICAQLGKSVEAIIETGRLLIRAKADIAPGEWVRFFDEGLVPFSVNTAQRLMKIAAHPQLSNAAHVQHLPPSWGTLYELSKAEPLKLKNALKDGVITPDMPRKAVAALCPPRARKPRALVVTTHLSQWGDEQEANAVRDALKPTRTLIEDWPDGRSFNLLIHEIKQLLKYVERLEGRSNVEVSA